VGDEVGASGHGDQVSATGAHATALARRRRFV
jgi:hypothetical protein